MAHRAIDGTLTVARLSGMPVLGGATYRDVTFKRADGREERIGRMLVLDDLRPVMVPGTRGRFYFHDVGGTRGMHGFRAPSGEAYGSFPLRWERMMALVGLLSLVTALTRLAFDGSFPMLQFSLGVIISCLAVVFYFERKSSMTDFTAENGASRGTLVRA